MLQARSSPRFVSTLGVGLLAAVLLLSARLGVPPSARAQGADLAATGGAVSLTLSPPPSVSGPVPALPGARWPGVRAAPLQLSASLPSAPNVPRAAPPPLAASHGSLRRARESFGTRGYLRRPDPGRSRFGKALIGSAIGTAVGALLGGLILSAAEQDDPQPYGDDKHEPEGTALLVMAGAPPFGAIANTDVGRGNAGAWALGVLGEVLLGGAGAALGGAVGGSDRGELIGGLVLGLPGVAVGAAGGVTLAAPGGQGALRYSSDTGTWSAGLPAVRVRPGVGPELGPVGQVSLVTVEL